jgi:hypothetical protein
MDTYLLSHVTGMSKACAHECSPRGIKGKSPNTFAGSQIGMKVPKTMIDGEKLNFLHN